MADRSIMVRLGAQLSGLKSGLDEAARAAKATAAEIEQAGKKADAALDGSAAKLPLLARAHKGIADASAKTSTWLQKNRADVDMLANSGLIMGGLMVAGVGMAVKKYADFDAQMSAVKATGAEARAEFGALRQAAIDMGADTAFSAVEAAKGIENLLKAGVSAKDVLGGGLAGALNLAAAGVMDVGAAAEVAATAMTQFHLAGKDVPHVADLLAAGAGKAQGEVADLAMALGQSGLVASQFGLSIEETVGSLAAFASAGLLGSDAGTSLKTMLLKLANPSAEASRLMSDLGIAAYDAGGNFVGMSAMAGQLQKALQSKTQAERDSALATIFGNDAIRAANVLYSQGASGIDAWIANVNDAGYASMVAATRLDNLKGDIEKLSGAIDSTMISSGSGLNTMFRGMVQGATAAVDGLNKVPGPILQIGAALTGAGGLAVVGIAGIAKLGTVASDAALAFKRMGVSAGAAKLAVTGIGVALAIGALALSAWAESAAKSAQNTSDLASTLVVVDGTVMRTASTMDTLNAKLQETKTGLFGWGPSLLDIMDKVGVSVADAQGYMAGNEEATKRVTAATEAYRDALMAAGGGASDGLQDVADLTGGLDALRGNLDAATQATQRKDQADREAGLTAGSLSSAMATTTATVNDGTSALEKYAAALKESVSAALSASNTQIAFEQAIDDSKRAVEDLIKATKDHKDLQDLNTQAGRDAQTVLNGLASATSARVQSLIEQKATEEEITAAMGRGRKAFVERAQDLGMTAAAIADMVVEYGMIPESVSTKVGVAGTADASIQLSTLKASIAGLPKETQTRVLSAFATGGIDAAYAALGKIDGKTAQAWVKSILERAGINAWNSWSPGSKNAYIKVFTKNYTSWVGGKAADGAVFERANSGLVQSFADGGFPSIGSQQPQIQPNHGDAGIQWAETGAGPWEAFISGHPAKRERSRALTSEVASRLGGTASFADGGMRAAVYGAPDWSPSSSTKPSAESGSAGITRADIRAAFDGATLHLTGGNHLSDSLSARVVAASRRI